jgi:hypothetical protein
MCSECLQDLSRELDVVLGKRTCAVADPLARSLLDGLLPRLESLRPGERILLLSVASQLDRELAAIATVDAGGLGERIDVVKTGRDRP